MTANTSVGSTTAPISFGDAYPELDGYPPTPQSTLRVNEEFAGFTVDRILKIVARYAADLSDLTHLADVHSTMAEILLLPPDQRKQRFITLSPVLDNFVQNEARYRAQEQIYTRDGVRFDGLDDVDDHGVAKAWFECFATARANQERKSVVTSLLLESIQAKAYIVDSKPIQLASIASGSARTVIETLQRKPAETHVRACLLDVDQEAIAYSRRLALDMKVEQCIETIAGANVIRVEKYLRGRSIDIIEAVGICDYLNDATIIFMLRQFRKLLSEGGVAIAANVMPHLEREFIHTAVGWRPMHYRTDEQFVHLFIEAGFHPSNCKVHLIPLGIFCIVEARK